MTDIMASLFVDIHPSYANLTLFVDGNCFLIAFTICDYFLLQVLPRELADSSTNYFVIHYMIVTALCLLQHSMESETKQILTRGSESRCLGEIEHLQSP